jgi:hypothetical protein
MYGGYGHMGHHHHMGPGYGGAMNSEMRSDMWIQQNIPGGLNSKYYFIENMKDFLTVKNIIKFVHCLLF